MPYQSVNRIQLYYEWHGDAAAFPLVLINGLLADTTGWMFQTEPYATHFRLLLYDCRGQGQSATPPGPYPTDQHAQDLVALLDALGVQQTHLVGLSNGGAVAMTVAATYPERVARLVVADSYAHSDLLIHAKLTSWLQALEHGGLSLRFDVATPWVWGQTFLAANRHLLAPLREKAASTDAEAVRGLLSGALDYDIRDQLGAIRAPTMVLVGEEDLLTPPWYAREICTAIDGAQLCVIPQAGHALPIERPALFNALTLDFLNDEG
jgi:3-oxoadipate enol-lactonase